MTRNRSYFLGALTIVLTNLLLSFLTLPNSLELIIFVGILFLGSFVDDYIVANY